MRARLVAAIGLLVVGLGAVGFVVFRPGAAQNQAQLLTVAAISTDVVDQVEATGTVSAASTYGLSFGSQPQIVSGSSTGSTGSTGSTAGGSSGGGTATWLVTTVDVKVGDTVKAGQKLAVADATSASEQLTLAQADLATAQARLASDLGGPSAADKAAAYDQVKQAMQSLTQARTNEANTVAQNDLKLAQAKQAVTDAQAKLDTDTAASAPEQTISADQNALAQAQTNLTNVTAQVKASNDQATNQLASAQLSVTSAKDSYATRIAPAADAQVASDRAAVARAQATVDDARRTVALATLVAPTDGVVSAVAVQPGVLAPSGSAIQIQTQPLEVTASVAESDRPRIKIGQQASITITAISQTVAGHVVAISPTASSGGQSSVVAYPVTIALDNVPDQAVVGMSATVTIAISEATGVIAVPAAAVTTATDGTSTVRVLLADGQTARRQVELGLVTRTYVEIKSGLSTGDRVVIGTSSTRTGTGANQGGFGGGGGAGNVPGGGFGGNVFRP